MNFKIIGVVHLLPLPGSPFYSHDLERLRKRAFLDAENLVRAGIRSIIVENFGDSPFFKEKIRSETLAVFTSIVCELRKKFPDIEIGVNVL